MPTTVCSVFTWNEEPSASSERFWLRAWCALLDWCHRTGPSHQSSCLGQKQLPAAVEELCGSASSGNTCPGSTSTSIMGHDSGVLEFLSLCSFFLLVGNSRPENDQQQYERELGPRQQTTVAHHQRRPPTAQEGTALTPTCDLLLAARIPDTGRSQSGEFGTSSNTQCGEGSRWLLVILIWIKRIDNVVLSCLFFGFFCQLDLQTRE